MNDTKILDLLQKNHDISMDSLTFNRKGGCVSYIVNSGNKKCFLKIIDNVFLNTAIQSIDIQQYLIENNFPVPKKTAHHILFGKINCLFYMNILTELSLILMIMQRKSAHL